VLGLPLERTAVDEGAAFGAALLGGVRAGVYTDAHDAVASAVRVTERIEPEESWLDAYASGYQRYRLLYPTLRPLSSL
jgi:xylulokinase